MNSRRIFSVLTTALLLATTNLSSARNINDSDSWAVDKNTPPRWILEVYAKKASTLVAETVMPDDLLFEQTDLNGDGNPDWVIYSTLFCGSAGCSADVYQFVGKDYCYVGWTQLGDAPNVLRNKYHNLKCQEKDKQLKSPL